MLLLLCGCWLLLLCVLGSCPNACWCFSTPKIARGVSRAVPEGAFGGVWWQNARPHRLPRAHEARSTLKSSGHACSLHGGQASDRLACGPVAGCLDVPVAGNLGQWWPVVHHPVHWPVVASGFAVYVRVSTVVRYGLKYLSCLRQSSSQTHMCEILPNRYLLIKLPYLEYLS